MVIMKLQIIFKYSTVYTKYTTRRNDLMNIDVVDDEILRNRGRYTTIGKQTICHI